MGHLEKTRIENLARTDYETILRGKGALPSIDFVLGNSMDLRDVQMDAYRLNPNCADGFFEH